MLLIPAAPVDKSGMSITDSCPSGLGPSNMCICVEGERREEATKCQCCLSFFKLSCLHDA